MSDFQTDLLFGQRAEERVRDLLCESRGFVSKFGSTNKNDFELIYQGHTHRIEIKCEDRHASTGNLCVELWQKAYSSLQDSRRIPSGLAVSEANIIIHTLMDNIALYRRVGMKARILEHAQRSRLLYDRDGKVLQMRRFGDNGNWGYLIPLDALMLEVWFDFLPFNMVGGSRLWLE